MNIPTQYTAGKLQHYSCVNGDQHANEQQKVVTKKRGSKKYDLKEQKHAALQRMQITRL